jgi:hypothetical protein
MGMIRRIQQYIKQKGIKAEDLFRLIDTNFDENITIKNLKTFLKNELKVTQDELRDDSLHRLYKLIDINK